MIVTKEELEQDGPGKDQHDRHNGFCGFDLHRPHLLRKTVLRLPDERSAKAYTLLVTAHDRVQKGGCREIRHAQQRVSVALRLW